MTSVNVNVFVGNDTLIDPDIYQLWLNGYSAQDAASLQQKKGNLQQYGATFEMLLSDILDHYRIFAMLERYLKTPSKLADQLELQITPTTQSMLIEKYYEFDTAIVRELLGKKLTSRYRNSLDEICEKMHVSLRSCRRQFDNIKRVYKTVEDLNGQLVDNIQANFLLSHGLTLQYAAIVFITNTRFDLSRKKLFYLTFTDFVHCSNLMISLWSYNYYKESREHDGSNIDLDREFLQSLRELKVLLDKEQIEQHRTQVLQLIDGKMSSASVLSEFDNTFKTMSKSLVNIAANLTHGKEVRDLFVDLLEKIIEPCRNSCWNRNDVQCFFEAYREAGSQLTPIRVWKPSRSCSYSQDRTITISSSSTLGKIMIGNSGLKHAEHLYNCYLMSVAKQHSIRACQ